MTYTVSGGTLNPTHSLPSQALPIWGKGRCPKEKEFHQIVPLEGESMFPSVPRAVDGSHFIEWGNPNVHHAS